MSDSVDINGVFSESVSEVTLDALSKKGFKQVKVLNQAHVLRLITDSVDRVLKERFTQISAEERDKVINESREQFESMARQKIEKERCKIEELEVINRSLMAELDTLKKRATASIEVQAERDQALARMNALETEVGALRARVSELTAQAEHGTRDTKEAEALRETVRRLEAEAGRSTSLNGELQATIERLQAQTEENAGASGEAAALRATVKRLEGEFAQGQVSHQAEVVKLKDALVAARQQGEEGQVALRQEVLDHTRRAAELEGLLAARTRELEERGAIGASSTAAMEALLLNIQERLAGKDSGVVDEIKEALSGLSDKLSRVSAGGGGDSEFSNENQVDLEAFFAKAGEGGLESNVSNVKVRQAKAGAVKGALAKLKELQKGGEDGE